MTPHRTSARSFAFFLSLNARIRVSYFSSYASEVCRPTISAMASSICWATCSASSSVFPRLDHPGSVWNRRAARFARTLAAMTGSNSPLDNDSYSEPVGLDPRLHPFNGLLSLFSLRLSPSGSSAIELTVFERENLAFRSTGIPAWPFGRRDDLLVPTYAFPSECVEPTRPESGNRSLPLSDPVAPDTDENVVTSPAVDRESVDAALDRSPCNRTEPESTSVPISS
mmetsp:Transcript_18084/g.37544  ORF Transcript_18084/g.37544 Transcript_18084/m.37544 type:complete len:226 (-) Transcript_18084:180-857(-)